MINEVSLKPIISNFINNGAADVAQQGIELKGVTLQLRLMNLEDYHLLSD